MVLGRGQGMDDVSQVLGREGGFRSLKGVNKVNWQEEEESTEPSQNTTTPSPLLRQPRGARNLLLSLAWQFAGSQHHHRRSRACERGVWGAWPSAFRCVQGLPGLPGTCSSIHHAPPPCTFSGSLVLLAAQISGVEVALSFGTGAV